MALTATATKAIRLSVSRTIGLKDPYVLTRSPCKSNLIYTTGTFKTVQDTFCVLADRLQEQKSCFQKFWTEIENVKHRGIPRAEVYYRVTTALLAPQCLL